MLGDNSIAIANPASLAYDLIPNFFGTPEEDITPFGVLASLYEHKITGLYIKNSQIHIVFMRNASQATRKNVSEIIPQGETILCVESARQKEVFFAGGGTKFKLKNGKAKLFAIGFDEQLDLKTSLVLNAGNSGNSSMGISCMKRVKDSDTLLAGTNGNLYVVKFNYHSAGNCNFELLSTVSDIHSWLITSIDYYVEDDKTEVFTVSRKD